MNDDWVDPSVLSHFIRLLALSDRSKVFLHHGTGGQDCVSACVTHDQFAALRKTQVNIEVLT